jgi:hypothetical protein
MYVHLVMYLLLRGHEGISYAYYKTCLLARRAFRLMFEWATVIRNTLPQKKDRVLIYLFICIEMLINNWNTNSRKETIT